MEKIILVYPDYRGGDIFNGQYLPVGLGYLARALENAQIQYKTIDLNIDSIDKLFDEIKYFLPHFLGISMMSFRCKATYQLIANLKSKFPNLTIIVGGPHVAANKDKVMKECLFVDIAVSREGETALVDIVGGRPLPTIKGIFYRQGAKIYFSGERDFIQNLDDIDFPTYKGFNLSRYGKRMQISSSRGCPYECIFCGAPEILGRYWRKRSAKSMIEEFDYWYEKGYRNFYFNDSNFAVDKIRIWNFCEEIRKRNPNVSFRSDGLRADHLDKELLVQMREAKFTHLSFGVESGSDKVLLNLRKGETRAQIEITIATAVNLGFYVTLFFLLGCPGEDKEDIRQSFQLACKYRVERVYFFNLTPIPGTEYYRWAVAKGYIDEFGGNYPEDRFGFPDKMLFGTGNMPKEELISWRRSARWLERKIRWQFRLERLTRKFIL
ncbi:MAG: radical SAM protein [Candidatus Omnitrophota bacterium]